MSKKNKLFILILFLVAAILYLVLTCGKTKYIKVDAEDVKEIILNESNFEIIDIRTKEEYKTSHIPESISIPYIDINEKIIDILSNKEAFIIVYGDDETKTKEISKYLISLGYYYVYDLGNISNWIYSLES